MSWKELNGDQILRVITRSHVRPYFILYEKACIQFQPVFPS
jgi:hypothetical protein